MAIFKKTIKKSDPIILSTVFILLFFGLVMLSSSGILLAKIRFNDEYYFFKHQLFFGVLPGLILMYFVSKINYQCWKKISVPLFFIALIALVLVFVPGLGMRFQGASRWIDLGAISFQPAEMMKLAIILYLASWIESRGNLLKDFHEGFVPFFILLTVVGFLIIKQPDMGTLGSIVFIAMSMFFISGAPLNFFGAMFGVGALLVTLLIKLEPYRMNRLLVFLNPSHDLQGVGYQINQALIAVGSGGILGLGLGHSRQKFNYLPEPIGDSIFAIVSEELGMVGAIFLLTVFMVFAFRSFKIAKSAPDVFARLVATGIASWIIFQTLINAMAIIGLVPLTGIPMPFISYGSTSLIFIMIGIGILLNISRYSRMD